MLFRSEDPTPAKYDWEISTVPSIENMVIVPGDGSVKLKFTISENPEYVDEIIIDERATLSFETWTNVKDLGATVDDTSPTPSQREIKVSNIENKIHIFKVSLVHKGNQYASNVVVVKPTSSAKSKIAGNDFFFIAPPTPTLGAYKEIRGSSLGTDTPIDEGSLNPYVLDKLSEQPPSPAVIKKGVVNPFDKTFNQKIQFDETVAIPKNATLTDLMSKFPIPTYSKPDMWDATNVFSIPPTIVPLKDKIGRVHV